MLNFRMNMPLPYMAFYGSILIVMVLLLRLFLKNRLPRFVFPALWMAVLIRLLVPFSLSSPLSAKVIELPFTSYVDYEETVATEVARDSAPEAGSAAQSPVSPVTEAVSLNTGSGFGADTTVTEDTQTAFSYGKFDFIPFSFRLLLPAAYILGLFVTAGCLLYQKYGYHRRPKDSLLMEQNETVRSIVKELKAGDVLVFTNDEIASPLVSGIISPRIYLPARMDFQNTLLLRHILTHEIVHIRHRDNLWKAVMLIAICVHWYNPLVWFMSKCLCSDLEDACDAAVLRGYDREQQKEYAFSLLSMAITSSRTSLLYSAFSKTEVERRIKSILQYKKASFLVLVFSCLFLAGSITVCATGGQAPFDPDLSSYCASSGSRWGVEARLARDIALDEASGRRADAVILDVLSNDTSGDPEIISEQVQAALAKEFGVEKSAFQIECSLCLDDETIQKEYAAYGLSQDENGYWYYQGEAVHIYYDELLGHFYSSDDGSVDVSVERDRFGQILSVKEYTKGELRFWEY